MEQFTGCYKTDHQLHRQFRQPLKHVYLEPGNRSELRLDYCALYVYS